MTPQDHKQAPAAHPQEQALLQGIVAHPHDVARWLVLADWLEEHDDPRRADLLRLHRQLIATCCEPDKHPDRAAWQERVVQLLTEGVRPSVPRQTVALAHGVDMAFHFIPPGTFLMGSPAREASHVADEFRHEVTLTQGFWLAVTPVTQAQCMAVLGDNPSHFKGDDRPVDMVSWEDCQAFCRSLHERDGRAYRLPTEAEWEYACRSGTTTPFFWGETISTQQACYDGSRYGKGKKGVRSQQTTAVGSFPCNGWGLFDMHGNVWEWCQDRYVARLKGPVRDPQGGKRGYRVLRGGCWCSQPDCCRSAFRHQGWSAGGKVGFRPAFGPG